MQLNDFFCIVCLVLYKSVVVLLVTRLSQVTSMPAYDIFTNTFTPILKTQGVIFCDLFSSMLKKLKICDFWVMFLCTMSANNNSFGGRGRGVMCYKMQSVAFISFLQTCYEKLFRSSI